MAPKFQENGTLRAVDHLRTLSTKHSHTDETESVETKFQLLEDVECLMEGLEQLEMEPDQISAHSHDPANEDAGGPDEEELRIILVGKTGVGKSAAGNTILGREEFTSEACPKAVTSKCQKKCCDTNGRKIRVIDTPGLLDKNLSEDELCNGIVQCTSLSSQGVHAILLVLSASARYTEEEMKAVEIVRSMFGDGVEKHMVVLFTGKDSLKGKGIKTYIEQDRELSELVGKCGDRCYALDNSAKGAERQKQVPGLLTVVDRMVQENGGRCYIAPMHREAEGVIGQIVRVNNRGKKVEQGMRRRSAHTTAVNTNVQESTTNVGEGQSPREEAECGLFKLIKAVRWGRAVEALIGGIIGGAVGGAVGGVTGGVPGGVAGAAGGALVGAMAGIYGGGSIDRIGNGIVHMALAAGVCARSFFTGLKEAVKRLLNFLKRIRSEEHVNVLLHALSSA